jgi:hypothetical protein
VLLTGVPHHLKVRAVADLEYRVRLAMRECNLNHEKAVRYVQELDEARDNWLKWVYGVETGDLRAYDLVINLQRIPVASASQIIAGTAKRDFPTTPESQSIVDDLMLASQIRAKIGLDRGISDQRVGVEAKDGVVTITAHVRSLGDSQRARELALQVPGVKDVQQEMFPDT